MLHMRTTAGVTGVPFLVVLDTEAEDHQRDKAGRVLWFDLRHRFTARHPETGTPFTVVGQFVTDWTAATFMDGPDPTGTTPLWGDEPTWRVGSEEMRAVREWVAECYSREGREVPRERPLPEIGQPQH
jgi:hypothetical protein